MLFSTSAWGSPGVAHHDHPLEVTDDVAALLERI